MIKRFARISIGIEVSESLKDSLLKPKILQNIIICFGGKLFLLDGVIIGGGVC